MKRLLTWASVLAVLATGGCASADPAPEVPPSSPAASTAEVEATPEPTPQPTPTPITRAEAGANYLALAEPWNSRIPAWIAAAEANDMAALRTHATENATALRAFVDGLVAAEWPDDVQHVVEELVGELAAEIPLWAAAGVSTTDDDFWWNINQIPATSSAQEVRVLLGLDNVPVG